MSSLIIILGVIKASPQSVIDLFLDNSRVAEYNEHVIQVSFARKTDIETGVM